MKTKQIYMPITKVDAAKRLVYGVLAAEHPDHSGEILDYDASKAAFQAWSDGVAKATGGKSAGNMRVMHTNKVAGIFKEVTCNDELKRVEVVGEVIDDAEWKLVQKGAYPGFSIGGKYGWKKEDGDLTRYQVSKMIEGSLVDAPCIPVALIDSIKAASFEFSGADGAMELRKFDVPEHPSFRQHFIECWQKVKGGAVKIRETVENIASGGGLKKGMWDVADLACALATINRIRINTKWEAAYEKDGSGIPERLRTWIDEGAEILKDLVDEEVGELTSDPASDEMVVLSAKVADLQKELAEMPNKITALLKGATPGNASEVAAGAVPQIEKRGDTMEKDLTKAVTAGDLEKALADNKTVTDEILKQLKDQSEATKGILDFIGKMAGLPEQPKVAANAAVAAVTKANDAVPTGSAVATQREPESATKGAGVDDREGARDSIKKSFASPQAVDPQDPRFNKSA